MLACVVLIPLAVYLVSSASEKRYESSVVLQVQATNVDTSLLTNETPSTEQTLAAAGRLIRTTAVAQEATRRLGPRPPRARSLLRRVTVTPDSAAGFLTITAADSDPRRAADIANAFAAAVVVTRARRARVRIDRAIFEVRRDLQRLGAAELDGRRQLSQQLQRLRTLRAAQGNNAEVVEPAVASASPVAPRPRRNAALALILAALLGILLAFAIERLDRRIRDPMEVEELTGASLLSIVPTGAFPGEEEKTPAVSEAFQTLRASLMYFNIDRPLTSVLITSPFKGDGKTTVATNLAHALARAGKDVILVDTDLRHPQVAARFGAVRDAGLGTALVGEDRVEDVIGEVPTQDGRLRILPSGRAAPNPSELLGSERMRSLLAELSESCDLVIIDTPPALVVSDAIPLFEQVSGVVVVGRVGQTTRDAMRRLTHVIATARGAVLGAVATGAKGSGLYGYGGYGGYFEPTPNGAAGTGQPAPGAASAGDS